MSAMGSARNRAVSSDSISSSWFTAVGCSDASNNRQRAEVSEQNGGLHHPHFRLVLRLFHSSTDGHLHSDHRQTGRQLYFLLGSAVLHSQQVLLSRRFDARRRVSCGTYSGCASEAQLFALLAHATLWFLSTCTTEAFWTLAVVLRQAATLPVQNS